MNKAEAVCLAAIIEIFPYNETVVNKVFDKCKSIDKTIVSQSG